MKDELERFFEKQKETFARAAEELWHGTIGEHVEQVLASGETLSLESLRSALERTVADNKADSLIRLRAEKALEKLDIFTPPLP
ncbi:hypothetical protein HOP54_02245 [Halomonas daqingensis]|uniref:hypothetical protein n=1 Tax=Billgrantia desiderata TaxID=52021 RepID=UPI001F2B677A|nr:hypothetical protein [Halomonas desiderata]MCE8027510.1 hypothetical protein [Halomonas desiderata]